MGSELIQLLEQEARAEKDKVLEEARRRAAEILAAARKDAEEVLSSSRKGLEDERVQARTRAASAGSLRAGALLLEAKDQAIQEVFARAAEELERASRDPARRRAILQRLLAEAVQGIETPGATLEVPPGDADAAREACRTLHLSVEVRESPDVRGGVRLTTKDRRIAVENTVASRLNRTRSILISRVAETLWGS
ncbi:MAG TPA: V-type ATP synthase subunit E [bacterium]|nr:V-type ATP synthase subunit E [bacterium]